MDCLIKHLFILFCLPLALFVAAENATNSSFYRAKKMLEEKVYLQISERYTLYCQAPFDQQKKITAPIGFKSSKFQKRARRLEWEHVVPAENFGRHFKEWREGNVRCINSKGKYYKGRRCAEKMNVQFRYMQADMYNLYPAIGAVNASRSNYNFTMFGAMGNSFGSCEMKIRDRKAQPPSGSRGAIARTYLYMDQTYSQYKMSRQQRQLMNAWNKTYPVNAWECKRAGRIKKLQKNDNSILQQSCQVAGFSYL